MELPCRLDGRWPADPVQLRALRTMMDRASGTGVSFRPWSWDGWEGYLVVGPPDLVLALIPGLLERITREDQEAWLAGQMQQDQRLGAAYGPGLLGGGLLGGLLDRYL